MDPEPDDVTFELERFGWASEDRLEVAGRWNGVRRRLARPTLVIVVGGRRRRLRTLPGAWGSSPEGWEATFGWEGEPVDLTGAELEVGRSIVVDLPRPRRLRQTAPAPAPAPSAEVAPEREVPAEPEAPPEVEAPAPLQGELDAARAEARAAREEAAAAREALEREQEEAAIARRALSAAREAEEDERSDAQSLRSELEELRGRHERAEEELAGARSELAAAQERVTAAVTAGREEAQQLHHEVARARASASAAPPQSHEVEVEAGPSRRRFDPARSGERSRTKRFGSSRQEEPTPALVAERTGSVTERAAAWASGAAERARGALSGDSSPDTGTPGRAPTAAAGRARPARVRARSTQRAFEPDSRHETSWALRAVAVGLVAVLLVALALIVSFLT